MAIRLLILDVDGVMTNGRLYYTSEGESFKAFHVQDGLGLKLLRALGVRIAVISGRTSLALKARLDDLGIHDRILGAKEKMTGLRTLLHRLGVDAGETAFMGDDLIDRDVMQAVGYAIAPANAVADILEIADFVTTQSGGDGAVREACEHIASTLGKSLSDGLAGGPLR